MVDGGEARSLLEEKVRQEFGEGAGAPELVVEDEEFSPDSFSPGRFGDNSIYVGRETLERDDFDEVLEVWMEEIADQALETVFDERLRSLGSAVGVEVDRSYDAHFREFSEFEDECSGRPSTAAAISAERGELLYNRDDVNKILPGERPEVTGHGMDESLRHEAGHAVQSAFEGGFTGIKGIVDFKTDSQDEYTVHPDRAILEALTLFEEDPEGEGENSLLYSRLSDEWKLPDALRGRIDGGSGYVPGDHLYSGPYDMGEVIAYTVREDLERKGVDDPVNGTRRRLLEDVDDAEGWEERLEGIWNDWGLPNYHRLFEAHYRRIQESGEYAEREFERLEKELQEPEEAALEAYYDAHAFVHAYRESGREAAHDLDRIEMRADSIRMRETGEGLPRQAS